MPSILFVIAGAYFAVFVLALLWNVVTYVVTGIAAALRARQLPNDVPSSEPSIIITLVHGTWARRAMWTLPGSPLCRTLVHAADAPVLFQRFIWSGRNSISARRRAVNGLIEHLHSLIEEWPHARHYVVAHSHGGNVAFQALADPLLNERIGGLVCLSTPFLTATRRDLGPVGGIALWWLPVLVIFYGGTFALQQATPSSVDTLGPVLLAVAVASGFLTSRVLRRFATSVLESLQYPAGEPSKTLILRAAGDEASAALAATHILSWVTGRLWLITSHALGRTLDTVERWRELLTRHRLTTALVAACLALVCVVALVRLSTSDPLWLQRVLLLPGVLLLLMVAILFRGGLAAAFLGRMLFGAIAAPFLLLIAILGVSLGPELLVAGLLFQVTAEATPPGRWVVWQVAASADDTDERASTGLMHSASYQNPKALEILEAWFAAVVRGHARPMPLHN
jgi:pimeloyl-ACP methyl ester carboxylesterase